jgi:hypothetical protein
MKTKFILQRRISSGMKPKKKKFFFRYFRGEKKFSLNSPKIEVPIQIGKSLNQPTLNVLMSFETSSLWNITHINT